MSQSSQSRAPGKPSLARITVTDRTSAVAESLAEWIGRSGLQPGDRLPTERELMETLGVGRSTVREVIRQFQARGIVESRQGSGTYLLRAISSETIHVPLTIDPGTAVVRDKLMLTLEVRRGLEGEASAVAAVRATRKDIAKIEQALDIMERRHRAEGGAGDEDRRFHLAIYDATHNPLFRQLLEQMQDAFDSFFKEPFDRPDFAHRSFRFHRELFDAIRDGDAALARQKTLDILAVVEDDIKEMSK
ncbi:FadR/GntR family transcriptional regulator [Trinickia dinghuensis]|uniref:FadR family transcriptional regulator n=1 Tax=Trinickia dinghuensis TaxID=2291023 RepID=A0A3D8JVU7_9BURK|nr:FadR/GntR family transcriptional regulator [Trinickia dinghuensis]RDU96724.1 FadR family transcriptional regulator [Trinickia dinghuensis]